MAPGGLRAGHGGQRGHRGPQPVYRRRPALAGAGGSTWPSTTTPPRVLRAPDLPGRRAGRLRGADLRHPEGTGAGDGPHGRPALCGHRHRHRLLPVQQHHRRHPPDGRRADGHRPGRVPPEQEALPHQDLAPPPGGAPDRGADAPLRRGKIAVAPVSLSLMEEAGAVEGDMEDIAAFLGQIEGVETSVTIRELEEGGCKLSVRTGAGLNASSVCALLGGGGHAAAAGCTCPAAWPRPRPPFWPPSGRYRRRRRGGYYPPAFPLMHSPGARRPGAPPVGV